MSNEPKIESVAYGKIEDMIAEFGAFDMGSEWFTQYGYTHCTLIMGDAQFETSYHVSLSDAKAEANEIAAHYGVKTVRA